MIFICGPCVVQDFESLRKDAELITAEVDSHINYIDFYFKASCIKDNRTSIENYAGPGFDIGIDYFLKIKNEFDIKITTDFHTTRQLREYGKHFDLIQIPAFLAMQTNLITEAVLLGKPIHIKKPQWLPPFDALKPISKAKDLNPDAEIYFTDRGTTFGYGNVMFDPRHVKKIKTTSDCDKVLVDITHLQNHSDFYDRHFAKEVGLAAIAAGADGLFMESTINPLDSKCDSDSMIPIAYLEQYLKRFVDLHKFIGSWNE